MTRSTTPATPRSRTAIPHSSSTSRRAASAVVSPRSTRPPGMLHWPAAGLRPRRTRRTRSPSRTTAPTPTRGWSGYSREVGDEPAALIPLGGPVLVAHEPVDELLLLAREPPRQELDPVRAGEALGDRGRRFGEARAPAQDLLERRDRKSTPLNSSHLVISYAVFCLKKKITLAISPNITKIKTRNKDQTIST